jgi:hypothetical protein
VVDLKMNWKIIGITGLVNAALTIPLSLIAFPLLVLGPLIGGFLASYLSTGYEDYVKMDKKDGAVMGSFSGIIGGIIIALASILGFGAISNMAGSISNQMGDGVVLTVYLIFQLTLIISFILGLVGGVIGVMVKDRIQT